MKVIVSLAKECLKKSTELNNEMLNKELQLW